MANEKVQQHRASDKTLKWWADNGRDLEIRWMAEELLQLRKNAARERELLKALREYRHPDPDADPIIFHDECFKDTRNVDTRCDLCKRADELLKEGE